MVSTKTLLLKHYYSHQGKGTSQLYFSLCQRIGGSFDQGVVVCGSSGFLGFRGLRGFLEVLECAFRKGVVYLTVLVVSVVLLVFVVKNEPPSS